MMKIRSGFLLLSLVTGSLSGAESADYLRNLCFVESSEEKQGGNLIASSAAQALPHAPRPTNLAPQLRVRLQLLPNLFHPIDIWHGVGAEGFHVTFLLVVVDGAVEAEISG